jgi:glycerophosphoryl diester phosphodiesterase
VHSFDHRIVRRLGEVRPALPRGILLSAYLNDTIAALRAVGATTLWQEWQLVDEPLVRMVHAAGCRIHAWTVNEVGDLEHLVRMGVDGLCGNYPDRIRVAIAARGGSPARV